MTFLTVREVGLDLPSWTESICNHSRCACIIKVKAPEFDEYVCAV